MRSLSEPLNPARAEAERVLGLAKVAQGRAAEAEPLLRSAIEALAEIGPGEEWRVARAESALGACFVALGRVEEGEALLLKSYNALREARGNAFIDTRAALKRLIDCYELMGRTDEAAVLQAGLDGSGHGGSDE